MVKNLRTKLVLSIDTFTNRQENDKNEPTIKFKRKTLQLCKENKIKYEQDGDIT